MKRLLTAALLSTAMTSPSFAQESCDTDSDTLDCAVDSLYAVISGPIGEDRDWDRLRSMFLPGATLATITVGEDGVEESDIFSIDGYIERYADFLLDNGFTERETRRVTFQSGEMYTLLSAYEGYSELTDEVIVSGVNTIIFMRINDEFKVATIMWRHADEEWTVERGFEGIDSQQNYP